MTQFRYGLEEKPIAFDNPFMDMYYQYNTFALKQVEFTMDMWKNQDTKNLWKDYVQAHKEGKTKEFIANMSQGKRSEFIRFVINLGISQMLLSLIGLSFTLYLIKAWRGDP